MGSEIQLAQSKSNSINTTKGLFTVPEIDEPYPV
jgi:hypothetical protein